MPTRECAILDQNGFNFIVNRHIVTDGEVLYAEGEECSSGQTVVDDECPCVSDRGRKITRRVEYVPLDRWEFLCAFSPKDVPKCSIRDRPCNALDIEHPFMCEREHVISPVLSRVR